MSLKVPNYLYGIASLSKYLKKQLPGFSFELTEGSVVDIAQAFDNIKYPGIEGVDASIFKDGTEVFYSCVDDINKLTRHPLRQMNFYYDRQRGVYLDPAGSYSGIRALELELSLGAVPSDLSLLNLLEAAALVSCFGFKPTEPLIKVFKAVSEKLESGPLPEAPAPPALMQRLYLSAVVSGEFAAAGLTMLRDFGVVEALWPELHALVGIDQAKEYHPEGDVWDHSLETLFHRKTNDLDLSLALLLHDLGKPFSTEVDGNRFNNHAQIGGDAAVRFLRRLEFSEDKIKKIRFLVENHMLPAAIKTLPTFRTEKAMKNPSFPLLLEVYRCDLLSTFMGPEGYYEACKAYRSFIRNTKNPFRDSDGKKLYRLYVD